MGKTLTGIGEFGLIDLIRKSVPTGRGVVEGIGDDTAVVASSRGKRLLLTADMLKEGVHFSKQDAPNAIGHKALACSISDIAAMGGVPTYAVVSLGIPAGRTIPYVREIYQGINRLARTFKIGIVGGDTIKSREVIINVALLGEVKVQELVLRRTAKAGDWIFVTGPLGGAVKGRKHLTFTPRLKESRYLVTRFRPSAMIDVSDGLVADLGHIVEKSRLAAVIHANMIPAARGASLDQALYEGEDFELIFTLPPAKARQLLKGKHPFSFHCLGYLKKGRGQVVLVDRQGRITEVTAKGFRHF